MKGKILFICVALLTLCMAIPASAAGTYTIQKNTTQQINVQKANPLSPLSWLNINCLVSAEFDGAIHVKKVGILPNIIVTITIDSSTHWWVDTLGLFGHKSLSGYGGRLILIQYTGTSPPRGDDPAPGPYYCKGFANFVSGYTN